MGLGMALMEASSLDPVFGDFTERDLAAYHVPACADVPAIEAHWLNEEDPHLNPMGSKGIGEIGIVGTAAAVANAVRHATEVRLRDLPLTPDKVLPQLPALSHCPRWRPDPGARPDGPAAAPQDLLRIRPPRATM